MTVEKKSPEIRFNGFSEEWQDKEIGSILAETKRPVELLDNELYQLVTVKRRNEGVVPRVSLKGKDILVKNYYGIKAGDYLISKRQVVHGANGIVPESLDNAVVSNEYLVLTDSDEITSKFWTVISKRPEMHKLFFISSYGVDIEKLVFDVSDWKNRSITIPDVAEQNAITTHFQKLDSLINQHQQKHDKLSNLKKAMLKKMFPKQGETVPEIRFKGFRGEWEEKELGEIGSFASGVGFSESEQSGRSGIPFFKVSDMNLIGNDCYMVTANNYVNEEQISRLNYTLIRESSILFAKVGAAIFLERKRIAKDFLMDNNMMAFSPTQDLTFMKQWFDSISLAKYTQVGALPSFKASDLGKIKLKIPKREEQTSIGNYFQKLDTLINQHQQQLTKLNNIKQACLSKMFV
ncbi:restriction endonuclease subunit S [Photobacterium sp. ZSDE20]|nr:restriction endonuclease subunit S [Photobacterium sp. ZSDE20]CAK1715758.1 type I restriction enzyme, S subunit [Vibrio crassostreae]